MKQRALAEDWKTKPMPSECVRLEWKRSFSEEQRSQICDGLVPEEMEDKWFIYYQSPTLHLHRSWTGTCIFKVDFEVAGDQWRVQSVTINRNQEQYRGSDEEDISMLDFLISNLLLGEEIPFPVPKRVSDKPKGLYQHLISGTGYPETQSKRWWQFWKQR